MLPESCRNMVLVYSAESNVLTPLNAESLNGHVDFLMLLNQGVSVDITVNDGRTAVRVAA